MFDFVRDREKLEREPEWIAWAAGPEGTEDALRAALRKIIDGEADPMKRRAAMLVWLLDHAPVGANPDNPFIFRVQTFGLMWEYIRESKAKMLERIPAGERAGIEAFQRCGAFVSMLDLSHTTPDWESLLALGVSGLRDRAAARLEGEADPENRTFLAAVVDVYDACSRCFHRLADAAREAGASETAERLDLLAERPPETLQDALTLGLFYDHLQDADAVSVRSQGIFDRLYEPFMRRDLECGRLDREGVKDLVRYYWTMMYAVRHRNGKNICLGGLRGPGEDACNELTRIALEVQRELSYISPKLSLRVHPDMDPVTLRLAAECVRDGRTAIVFASDVTSFDMLRRRGKEERDIYNYLLIGCYEPAIQGREMCCSMAAWGSVVKPLEAVFSGGVTFDGVRLAPDAPVPRNYAEFEAEYFRILDHMLDQALARSRRLECQWPLTYPEPLISGTMTDCVDSGRDVSRRGARYNPSGVMCGGLGTAVDSLLAVKLLVDERKLCTVAELGETLKRNWADHPEWRELALARAPKWGNGVPEADALGRKIADHLAERINHTPNAKGGFFQLGLWSIDHNFQFGRVTGATPDGRLAGDAVSRNLSATTGFEKHGVTGLMRSALKLDLAESPDGAVLDVMLHPSAVAGPDGAEVIETLIRTYLFGGGLHLQFNILNPEQLKEAQIRPDAHADLQIRVCGWNSRFVTMSREEQDAFIRQAESAR